MFRSLIVALLVVSSACVSGEEPVEASLAGTYEGTFTLDGRTMPGITQVSEEEGFRVALRRDNSPCAFLFDLYESFDDEQVYTLVPTHCVIPDAPTHAALNREGTLVVRGGDVLMTAVISINSGHEATVGFSGEMQP